MGTVYKVERRRKNKDGSVRIYEGYQLTYKGEKNITKTIYVNKEKIDEAKKLLNNNKKLNFLLKELLQLNIELFKVKS